MKEDMDGRGKNLVLYLAQKAQEEGVFLGITRLIKMVYLVDLAYAENYGETYTGYDWIFHHYGPYAREVEEAVKDFITEEKADNLTIRRINYTGLQVQVPPEVKELADDVFGSWARASLDDLLDYVYSSLPMRAVSCRGEKLNLTLGH